MREKIVILNLHVVRNEVKDWRGSSVEDLSSVLKYHENKSGCGGMYL